MITQRKMRSDADLFVISFRFRMESARLCPPHSFFFSSSRSVSFSLLISHQKTRTHLHTRKKKKKHKQKPNKSTNDNAKTESSVFMKPTHLAFSLAGFISKHHPGKCVVLTGAGCSTESGIPDYRGPHGRYHREDFVPLTLQNFLKNDYEKKRYWLRSMLGYSTMLGASCNAAHMGLHRMTQHGVVVTILTQNVDGLHHLAAHGGRGDDTTEGQQKYVTSPASLMELHGNIHQVICLGCGDVTLRHRLQQRLVAANPILMERYATDKARMLPDGDYHAPEELVNSMVLVGCEQCGGALKPHVVLFGENVQPGRVAASMEQLSDASCLLCLGTSLQVYSAYRYVVEAKRLGVPIAIVNAGRTRADGMEDLRVTTPSVARTVRETVEQLLGPSPE